MGVKIGFIIGFLAGINQFVNWYANFNVSIEYVLTELIKNVMLGIGTGLLIVIIIRPAKPQKRQANYGTSSE